MLDSGSSLVDSGVDEVGTVLSWMYRRPRCLGMAIGGDRWRMKLRPELHIDTGARWCIAAIHADRCDWMVAALEEASCSRCILWLACKLSKRENVIRAIVREGLARSPAVHPQ
jgi:hypothetical protein